VPISHVCLSCLKVFSSERVLKNHERCCLVHSPQQIAFLEPEQCKLTFNSRRCEHPFDFYHVADFESILKPHDDNDDDDDPTLVNTHETAGFSLHRMTPHENYQTPPSPIQYRTPSKKILEHIFVEAEKTNEIMSVQRPMISLEKVERDAHEKATTCRNCKSPFTKENPKCHHHNHVSGNYLPFCGMPGLQFETKT